MESIRRGACKKQQKIALLIIHEYLYLNSFIFIILYYIKMERHNKHDS